MVYWGVCRHGAAVRFWYGLGGRGRLCLARFGTGPPDSVGTWHGLVLLSFGSVRLSSPRFNWRHFVVAHTREPRQNPVAALGFCPGDARGTGTRDRARRCAGGRPLDTRRWCIPARALIRSGTVTSGGRVPPCRLAATRLVAPAVAAATAWRPVVLLAQAPHSLRRGAQRVVPVLGPGWRPLAHDGLGARFRLPLSWPISRSACLGRESGCTPIAMVQAA